MLNRASQCYRRRYFERKGRFESICVFQESLSKVWQKDPRQCICYVTGMEWTFKWIYLETNESELLLCFLKIKTWRHILGKTLSGQRNPALLFLPPVNVNAIHSISAMSTLCILKTVLKTYVVIIFHRNGGIYMTWFLKSQCI